MRAKKFGIPVTEDAKKAARAARFGISNYNTDNHSFGASKQRSERFVVNFPSRMKKFNKGKRTKMQPKRFGTQKNQYKAQERLRRFKQTGSFY